MCLGRVNREDRVQVNTQRRTDSRRMKYFSKVEGALDERQGVRVVNVVGDGPIARVSFQRYDREYNSRRHMGLFARGVSPFQEPPSQPSRRTVLS